MMRSMTLSELETSLNANLFGVDRTFSRVCTDSRQIFHGDVFVALKGANLDGHNFLDEVRLAGVPAILCKGTDYDLSKLEVEDTQLALGGLGGINRTLFPGFVAAITGSSGKTTVKNLVTSVFAKKAPTIGSKGNLNNEIGVPLTLLNIGPSHEFAVIEMGAGKPGDIKYLCELVRPNAALALNALPAHLQGMGDLSAVVEEKGSIYDSLPADGVAIINNDEPASELWRRRANPKVLIDFSVRNPRADVYASNLQFYGIDGMGFRVNTQNGFIDVNLKLPGVHNVSNSLAAVSFGLACDIDLEEIAIGIESVSSEAGRLTRYQPASGALVIDDCYNANPGSVRAAIDVLAKCDRRSTLILGSMQELGAESDFFHREIGKYAKDKGIENLWGLGDRILPALDAFGQSGRWFSNKSDLIDIAVSYFGADDAVLIKGSRSEALEVIVESLINSKETSC